VTWSFPNQRLIRAEIARAGAQADAAAAQFDATVINALTQTQTALSNYAHQMDNQTALQQARSDAATASDQAQRLYTFGRTDFLNVLNAEAALASADVALSQSEAAVADDQVTVFQTLGGGWEP
jgi:outer membrane protein TolC